MHSLVPAMPACPLAALSSCPCCSTAPVGLSLNCWRAGLFPAALSLANALALSPLLAPSLPHGPLPLPRRPFAAPLYSPNQPPTKPAPHQPQLRAALSIVWRGPHPESTQCPALPTGLNPNTGSTRNEPHTALCACIPCLRMPAHRAFPSVLMRWPRGRHPSCFFHGCLACLAIHTAL